MRGNHLGFLSYEIAKALHRGAEDLQKGGRVNLIKAHLTAGRLAARGDFAGPFTFIG
jgi:hypothetical protein